MSDTNIENQLRLANSELNRRITELEETLLENERTGEALQESEKSFVRFFESARDGLLILDAGTGKVIDVNPFLLELLGYSYEALHGQYIWELGIFKNIAASKDAFKTLQDNECIRYDDLTLENRDGQPIVVEFVSNNYILGHNRVILCNIRDITEHIRLSSQFQQSQKMESVGLLAGGVAHDYNNMLTVILGYAELALRKTDPTQQLHADLEEIIKAAKYSTAITRQLLSFARMQTIIPKVIDLNHNVENMLKMLRKLLGEDIDLAWMPEEGRCPVKMDPAQIDQILANLCVNARDAISDVGKVTIETGNAVFDKNYCAQHAGFIAGKYVLLSVSDDGCGMDREILGRIFEPFFTSKEVGQGTGLGLSNVNAIVKKNNGFINVYSEPGQGTTFRIYLPRYADKAVDTQMVKVAEIPQSCGETVLVVEDEPALLRVAKVMLEELGYRVLAAGTPGEAIRIAEVHANEVQLLLTDVVMPEMNGRDLAERLQSLYPGMKILFMSGYTANVIVHRGVLDEGVNFIQKPFSLGDLAVKVRKAVRMKE